MTAAAHKTITAALTVLSLALAAALIKSRHTSRSTPLPEVQTVTDTIIIRDTVHIALPRPQTTDTIGYVTIPVTAPALPDRHTGTIRTDTLHITDTIYTYIRLPLEQRYYTGPQYEAWVSGHSPRLDSLHIRTQTLHLASNTTVTQAATTTARPPKPGRWGIGIHLGYGMAITPQPQPRPYIGIGISYNIITF